MSKEFDVITESSNFVADQLKGSYGELKLVTALMLPTLMLLADPDRRHEVIHPAKKGYYAAQRAITQFQMTTGQLSALKLLERVVIQDILNPLDRRLRTIMVSNNKGISKLNSEDGTGENESSLKKLESCNQQLQNKQKTAAKM